MFKGNPHFENWMPKSEVEILNEWKLSIYESHQESDF